MHMWHVFVGQIQIDNPGVRALGFAESLWGVNPAHVGVVFKYLRLHGQHVDVALPSMILVQLSDNRRGE